MNRVHTMGFRLVVAFVVVWSCSALSAQSQTPSPSPETTKASETETEQPGREEESVCSGTSGSAAGWNDWLRCQ